MEKSLLTYDVLIIGAGPAGATTALLLAQAGWSVAIVEKKEFPRRKVCGEFISATSLPLLHKLGIADLYLAEGGPEIKQLGLFVGDVMLTSAMPPTTHSLGQWGRAYGREYLDSALLNQAIKAGAKRWQPYTIKNIQRNGSLFRCTITSKIQTEEISARIIIKAHGSWEGNIEQLNHKPSDLLAFKAHFRNCDLVSDLMPLLAFPGGYGGLVHTDHGKVTLSCCIRRDVLQNIRHKYIGLPAGEAVLQHIMATCRGARLILAQAKREGNWLSVGPIRPGIRQRYADGVFFVGNIAGESHPIIAEGISMAMQSGWLLSQILIHRQKEILLNATISKAGKDYSKQWTTHFAKRIYAASLFAQLATRPWASHMILPFLKRFPGILTLGAKLSGKIQKVC